ncbi:hypothetical protein Tco_0844868 [Tanacetum coccineum]
MKEEQKLENLNTDVEWENMKSNSKNFGNQVTNMNSQVHLENVRSSKENVGASFLYSGHGLLVAEVGISGYGLGSSLVCGGSYSSHGFDFSDNVSFIVLDFENSAVRLPSAKEDMHNDLGTSLSSRSI